VALREDGRVPPGVDPAHHRVRSASIVLPSERSFLDGARDAVSVIPGVPQTSV
jgi:phthalate 4,5-dioxygenase oxygenase subunit